MAVKDARNVALLALPPLDNFISHSVLPPECFGEHDQ
jgi:hypothetical protein